MIWFIYFREGYGVFIDELSTQMAKIGVYSKVDFLKAYGVGMRTFEKWVVEMPFSIGWEKGKQQKFPPAVVQKIFEHLGEPT